MATFKEKDDFSLLGIGDSFEFEGKMHEAVADEAGAGLTCSICTANQVPCGMDFFAYVRCDQGHFHFEKPNTSQK